MPTPSHQHEENLARRVYSYYIFRLRQPDDAERLTRLSFERVWEAANLGRDLGQEPELPVFAVAQAVIAENPRQRGASRLVRSTGLDQGEEGSPTGLSNQLAMALGRLHGRERDALALRFGAALSVGEIAELLDRTPAEVKQRVARGVRTLIDLGVLPKDGQPRRSAAKGPRARGSEQCETEKRETDE